MSELKVKQKKRSKLVDRNRLLNAFDGVVIPQGVPLELQATWMEHAKIKARPTERTMLQMSNQCYAYLMEEIERAKEVDYTLSLRRIQKLGKRAAQNPLTNIELEPEKLLVVEQD